MSLASRTLWTLRRYWADRLGVSPDAFGDSGATVGPGTEGGIELLLCEDAVIAGAPTPLLDAVSETGDALGSLDPDADDAVREWFDRLADFAEVHGPTFYGYVNRETFDPVESDARVLRATDEPAYRDLRAAVPDEEWDRGGPEFAPGETVGLIVDGELAAVAGFEVWDGLLAHIGVVTHPDHRGQGCGQAVVSRTTERALADGRLPQYRTLDAWPWSVALARNLGYRRFATSYLGIPER